MELEDAQLTMHMASVQLANLDSVITGLKQKEEKAKAKMSELSELKESITHKLYKNVKDYLNMFPTEIKDRDPTGEARRDHQMIRSQLEDSQSLQQLGSKVPLIKMNQQVANFDGTLQGLSTEVKALATQMKSVLDFFTRAGSKERQMSQSSGMPLVRGRSNDKAQSQIGSISSLTVQP